MKRIFTLFILLLSVLDVMADNYPTGAKHSAMGGVGVATADVWSVYHNQAALAYVDGFRAGIYYENRFNLPEFGVKSMALSFATKPGTFGLSFTSFGFSKFSDNKIGLAYALQVAKFLSIGIQLDYIYLVQDSYYGNIGCVAGEIGFYARPTDNLAIGGHLFNPWRTKVVDNPYERVPTIFRLGFSYDFSSAVSFSGEIEKNLRYPVCLRSGVKYEPINNFNLLAGIAWSGKNVFPSVGIGYTFRGITLDLAFEKQLILGPRSCVSISYRLGSKSVEREV